MASVKGRLTAELYLLFERMKAFGQSKRRLKVKAMERNEPQSSLYRRRIFSYSTFESYKPRAKRFVHWCADRFGVERLGEIKAGMLREYASEVLSSQKPNSVKGQLAAIAKLGEGIGKADSFHQASVEIQRSLPEGEISRPGYGGEEQAQAVLELVEVWDERSGLAMRVQLETACRLCEVERLRSEDLMGLSEREGEKIGRLKLRGKGGRVREVDVCEQTYRRLETALNERRKLIDYESYRLRVYRASKKLGLKSGGTHKARRFSVQQYAKQVYKESVEAGASKRSARRDALEEANRRLGHSPDRKITTLLYLGEQEGRKAKRRTERKAARAEVGNEMEEGAYGSDGSDGLQASEGGEGEESRPQEAGCPIAQGY